VHHVVSAAERRDHVGSEGFGDRELFSGDLVESLSPHAEVGVAEVWLVQRQPVGEEVRPAAVVPVSGSGSSRPSVQLLPSATNRVVADGDRTSCFELAMKTGRKAVRR
jgi:hypothetical protein